MGLVILLLVDVLSVSPVVSWNPNVSAYKIGQKKLINE